jgi:rare lipoprotein A
MLTGGGMRKLVIGCAVAGLIALSPKSEARLTASIAPLPLAVTGEKPELGWASWYGEECAGNLTASGEVFDMMGLTAAHRTLPLGTTVQVTNLRNNKAVLLRVNDRGPSLEGRVVDVSRAAAQYLGFLNAGLTRVQVKVVKYPAGHKGPVPAGPALN